MEMNKMDDNELKQVAGGQTTGQQTPTDIRKKICPDCKEERIFHLYTGGRAVCQTCGKEIMM